MKKIIEFLKKFFTTSEMYICEKCGWETNHSSTTEKLKQHCKNCEK